jgi:DNA-binding PadR family transcriptional regulator
MQLKPISFLILGLVRFGATSGYAIKKAADAATGTIWPISLAQVYPELTRLESGGLLSRREDPHGARTRSAYELTEKGEQALLTWLRSPRETPTQIRSEAMLRFFFADALPREDQVALVRRLRATLIDIKAHMYDGDLRGAAKAIDAGEMSYPIVLGAFAEAFFDFAEQWFARLEAQLEDAGSGA